MTLLSEHPRSRKFQCGNRLNGAAWSISTGESFFAENISGNIYKMEFDANGIPTSLTLELVGEGANSNGLLRPCHLSLRRSRRRRHPQWKR